MSGPRIGELFAGYGGLGAGVREVLGGDVAWVSEIDPGACKILEHRFPGIPNHGDITTIDWAQVEPVDVLTGGFPCQDVSSAGKRAGLNSETRSGLWAQMVRAIDELRPPLVVAENVRGLLSACATSELERCPRCLGDESQPHRSLLRALGRVLGDLADLGYDARWGGLRAADVGAPHGRFRVFVVAWPAADTPGDRRHEGRSEPARLVGGPDAALGGDAAPDADQFGRGSHVAGLRGRQPDAHRGAATDPDGGPLVQRVEPGVGTRRHPYRRRPVDWGIYTAAVQRWERTLGRPAPPPTEPGGSGMARVRQFAHDHGIDGYTAREMLRSGKWGARLSPAFVEWMQGLPAGWVTDVPGLGRNEQLKALGNGVVPQQAAQALRLLLPDVVEVAA